MNSKITTLAILLFMTSVCAEYVPIDSEPLYCTRYDISFWCNEAGMRHLETLPQDALAYFGYINEYAFSDNVRYTGDLRITNIDVKADLTNDSNVEAIYTVRNSGQSNIVVNIKATALLFGTEVYENGQLITDDPQLVGWNSTFAPNEEKEIILLLSEPLYGHIYGYNTNLLFDTSTIDNHLTPTGKFEFTLPEYATNEQCAPSTFTNSIDGDRTIITWEKTDFLPWTNPFNDLVCVWNITAGETPDIPVTEEPPGDNTPTHIILILLIIGGVVFYLKKTGRLERD